MRELGVWFHVAAMMIAFALLPGAGFLLRRVALNAADPNQAIAAARLFAPVIRFGAAAVALGALAGLALAASYGFVKTWLVATYVLFVLSAVVGAGYEGGWARRLAGASSEDAPSILREKGQGVANAISFALWLAMLWLMVAKPGG